MVNVLGLLQLVIILLVFCFPLFDLHGLYGEATVSHSIISIKTEALKETALTSEKQVAKPHSNQLDISNERKPVLK